MKNDSGDLNRFNGAEFCYFVKTLSMEISRCKGSRLQVGWSNSAGILFRQICKNPRTQGLHRARRRSLATPQSHPFSHFNLHGARVCRIRRSLPSSRWIESAQSHPAPERAYSRFRYTRTRELTGMADLSCI